MAASGGRRPPVPERNAKGLVTLTNASGLKMVYTVDGTAVATNSPTYKSPISLPSGGTLQAACLTDQGRLGMVASKSFTGLAPIGWKAVADIEETSQPAANAIDGDPSTIWSTPTNAASALPHSITIDMGASHQIGGVTYLPRQDGNMIGVIETFRFETSPDGRAWTTNVASGRFGNIRNNPTLQEVTFASATARFFRFTALQEVNSNACASAAEISVLPADK